MGILHTWSYAGYEFRVWDEGQGDGTVVRFDGTGTHEFTMHVFAAEILALAAEVETRKARFRELAVENADLRRAVPVPARVEELRSLLRDALAGFDRPLRPLWLRTGVRVLVASEFVTLVLTRAVELWRQHMPAKETLEPAHRPAQRIAALEEDNRRLREKAARLDLEQGPAKGSRLAILPSAGGAGVSATPLPCPFCGGTSVVHPKYPDMEGAGWGEVRCENPRCPARPSAVYYGDYQPKAIAVRRWNRRAG